MICQLLRCLESSQNTFVALPIFSVFASILSAAHAGDTLKIGYISHFTGDHGGSRLGPEISGALSFAAEIVNNSTFLLGDDKVVIVSADEKGDPGLAQRLVVEMFNANVSVIIGPENFCKYQAHLATALGLPIFSYKCDDATLQIKETNLISFVPTEKYVAEMLFKLFDRFRWRKFTLVYEEGTMWPLRIKLRNYVNSYPGSKYIMKEQNYASPVSAACDRRPTRCRNHVMAEVVRSTKESTRIYVMLGKVSDLTRFGFTLATMGLTERNEYKVIYISTDISIDDLDELLHLSSDPSLASAWHRLGLNVGFKHVLSIVPQSPRGMIQSESFENIVTEYNKRPPFHLTSPPSLGTSKVPIFAYYLRDCLMTWASAVTNLRHMNKNWTNGAVVAKYIRNAKVIPSSTGINMTLEEDGHIVGEYDLLSFNFPSQPRSRVGNFTVIGRFWIHNQRVNLALDSDPFDGQVILDEPVGGFFGVSGAPTAVNSMWDSSLGLLALAVYHSCLYPLIN